MPNPSSPKTKLSLLLPSSSTSIAVHSFISPLAQSFNLLVLLLSLVSHLLPLVPFIEPSSPFCCMQKTIERYQRNAKDNQIKSKAVEDVQFLKEESVSMTQKIDLLEASKRKLMGQELDSCSTDELQEMENQLEKSLALIRAKKNELYKQKIQQLKEKERYLTVENSMLHEKNALQPFNLSTQPPRETVPQSQNSQNSDVDNEILPESEDNHNSDVETELCIGRPDRDSTRNPCRKCL